MDEVEAVRETFAHGKSAQVVLFYVFLFLLYSIFYFAYGKSVQTA